MLASAQLASRFGRSAGALDRCAMIDSSFALRAHLRFADGSPGSRGSPPPPRPPPGGGGGGYIKE
jgi:hypothetical protein